MKNFRIFRRFFMTLGALTLISCGNGRDNAEVSYRLSLSSSEAVKFKSDLREFALQNEYDFIDRSNETKNAREYINDEVERLGQRNPGLVGQGIEVIDVAVEPKNSGLEFFIFAKTSAYDAEKISLTVIHNKNSALERSMVNSFQSQFIRNWHQ